MDSSFWISRFGEENLEPYKKAGFTRMGFGKKLALLNVDMTYMFFDPSYAMAYGDMHGLLESVTLLTETCREKNIPLFYSRRDDRSHFIGRGLWNEKLNTATSESYTVDPHADEWPPEFGPHEADVIIYKNKPSPFFGTPLAGMLSYIGVDTLIVIGISTSGCVRAAVSDAFSYNIRPIVPVECAGDRCVSAHWANLFDMDMKFADVLPLQEVLDYIKTL